MLSERFVIASIVAILIAALALSLFVISVEGSREYFRVNKIDIKLEKVNESHAEIKFLIYIERSKIVKNATLDISIYDMVTNLLLSKLSVTVPEKGKGGLSELNVTIPFEKDKNYKVFIEAKKNEKTVDLRGLNIRALNTLIPDEKNVKTILKDVDFIIEGLESGCALIKARFYIESMSNYNITFHIKAVQNESNILAAEEWINKTIKKGKTEIVEARFKVPKDYNYLVKIEIWRGDFLIKTWTRFLNLSPTKKIPEKVKEEKVEFEVEEFVKPVATPPLEIAKQSEAYRISGGLATPGFEIILALFAIGGALVWKRRN